MDTVHENALIVNYQQVANKIAQCAHGVGRTREAAGLVLVSKGQDAEAVGVLCRHVLTRGTKAVLGESRVQEYHNKRDLLPAHRVHFIGRLQRNKVKEAVALFDVIESVATPELAGALDQAAGAANKRQDVFLQVNISADPAKSGFSPAEVAAFIAEQSPQFANLRLCGLMTITRYYEQPQAVRPDFHAMASLFCTVRADPRCAALIAPEFQLSMGMSSDFEIAIEEGATLVRVGTAIFGERD